MAFHSNRSGNWQIWRADPDGSKPVQLSNSAPLINSGTCQLVDESDLAVLASAPLPASAGSVQVSLTATDTVAAGTVVDVSCSAGLNLGTITAESAGIAAIQF